MSDSQEHPLFIHSILLFVIALLVIVTGVVNLASIAKAQGVQLNSLDDAVKLNAKVQGATGAAGQLTAAPTDVNSAFGKVGALNTSKNAAKDVTPYVGAILVILLGLLTGGAGFYVFQQNNWARYASFGAVTLVLVYMTYAISLQNAAKDEDFAFWRPLVVVVVAGLCGKLLFDLFVEKFEGGGAPAAEPAPAHH